MIINALIINLPTSPKMSLQSYLPPTMSRLEFSSTDDGSDNENQSQINNSHLKHPESDITLWHHDLAKSLISLYHNMHTIITHFDEISQSSFSLNTEIHHQHEKIKFEMMRMVLMLNPSELSTYNNNQIGPPYTDLRSLDDIEDPVIQEKFYEHEKLRINIQRILSRLKLGMEKLRLVLFSSSYRDKSADYIRNYRQQIEKSLLKIRRHMIEYNQANNHLQEEKQDDDEIIKHQKTILKIIAEMDSIDPIINQRINDYKLILQPKRHKENEKYEFISSPFILLEPQYGRKMSKIKGSDCFTPSPDELLVFPDLIREAHEFFDFEPSISALKHGEEYREEDFSLPLTNSFSFKGNKENSSTISIEDTLNTSKLPHVSSLNVKSIITSHF